MPYIVIEKWKVGMDKIKFNKILRQELGYSLVRAKEIVDDVLNNKKIIIEITDVEKGNVIKETLCSVGIECHIQE